MYIVVSIGNSDDKLTQKQWSEFAWEIDEAIRQGGKVHFFGGPPNWMTWQNAAWIAEIEADFLPKLKTQIEQIRRKWFQDSAFMVYGDGHFI